jgi:hypothetical protein
LPKGRAIIGVADHCGWAILMTVADTTVLDRRRVELVDDALPKLPHHHEAQALPPSEGVALVERVRRSADACAKACLEALAAALPVRVEGLALRQDAPLPATIAERISNYRAQTMADSVMYRDALAHAATARGWSIHRYDVRSVMAEAAKVLGRKSLADVLENTGAALGSPWQKDHRVAMAAAIAAAGFTGESSPPRR